MAKANNPKLFGGLITNGEIAIGIDQSLTGFAMSAVVVADPEKHMTMVYKSPYNGVQRLSDIQQFMHDFIKNLTDNGCSIVDIAMEGTVLASHSALLLGELSATVKLKLYSGMSTPHLRTPLMIPPMTLKKYVTGKGTSKKQEMLLQTYKRFGVEMNDDNAVDAYGLARLAAGVSLNEIDAAIVEQVKDPKYRDTVV